MPSIATGEQNHHGIPDRCSGCNISGVSLLACDDPDFRNHSNVPGTKPRFCANCMIGKKVRVFWPVDSSWYTGVVLQHDPATGEHLLKYDDEDTEWVKIGESNTCGPPQPPLGPPTNEGMEIPPISPADNHVDPRKRAESPHSHPGYPEQHNGRATPDERHWHLEHPAHPDAAHPSYGPPPGLYHPSAPPAGYGMPPPGYHHIPPGSYPPQGPPPYGYPPMMNMPPGAVGSNGEGGYPSKPPSEPSSSPNSLSGSGSKRKTGPKAWTKEEDAKLLNIVQSMRMPMKWSIVAQSLPERTGKQCRERYVNHLNPRLKVTDWSPIEDATIFHLYSTMGSHWAKMSKIIIGRTDNGIKNRFHNLRRQLEREDEHRLRLSTAENFPEEIRLDRLREFPEELKGKEAELWDMKFGIGVLAAQSVLGGSVSRNSGRFGPFRLAEDGELCVRCGFLMPSIHTGTEVCTKSGWCQSCTRIPPHVCSSLLRECLNLRREQDPHFREQIESWEECFHTGSEEKSSKA